MQIIPEKSVERPIDQDFPWHHKTWQQFSNARALQQLPHAILLTGEEGIAKLSLANRMAKSLLCINAGVNKADACNACQSCKTYESGANSDFTQVSLLEDKQQIGVDQIRALSEFLNYSRTYNTHRVVIINPVERMNVNAANSLLKSLEEPALHTVIILVTSKMSQLLPTIKSRCQLFTVATPNHQECIQWLQHYNLQQQDNVENSPIDPESLIAITGNKPLNAIKLSQQDIESRKEFFEDLSSVIKHQITITEMAKKWEKVDFESLLNWQIIFLNQKIKSAFYASAKEVQAHTNESTLTQHLSTEEHWQLYQSLIKQKQYIHTSVNPLMFLENMIMLWTKTI